jgi:uncharacterized NAD(P)/FAD-binding protein YdhS
MQVSKPAAVRAVEAFDSERTLAIIGAGFSGTAVAIQFLRHLASSPSGSAVRIVLIDPRAEVGAGVAYATRDYPYPLNVAAGQMSLDGASPEDFLDFVRHQGIHASAADYLPRQVYGDYLRCRLGEARAAAGGRADCVHHRSRALQLRRGGGGRWLLWLDDGSSLQADDVVLALGNAPPGCPAGLASLTGSDRYVRDPWSIGSGARAEPRSVLLVGSGLTMIDAALRLAAIRPRVRHIHVLSRHGRLPAPQISAPVPAIKPDVAGMLRSARGSIRQLVRGFRALARDVDCVGGDWREVLGLARSELPAMWRTLDRHERSRFLRHVRSIWDIHRHRVPAGPLSAVNSLAHAGVLDVNAGRIEQVNAADDAVEVIWRPRGAQRTRAWLVDLVINCTGPESRVADHADPFVQSLLSNGLIRSDPLALGIDVDDGGRPLGADGRAVARLYCIGPWLRARDWEATAVPELREHAARLAQTLRAGLPAACGVHGLRG